MLFFGLEGHSDVNGRDLTSDAMKAVASRMSRRYEGSVHAVRYTDRGWLTDGFMVWTEQVAENGRIESTGAVYQVPVRRRRWRLGGRWAGPWQEVQSVPAAAHTVASTLSRRL